jgi:diguanylate cyclase (GGDEF)-like protein
MASITKLRTSETIRFFDHSVALSLVQAFHRHLDLNRLLEVFWSQSAAVVQASSLRYRNPEQNIEERFGRDSRHSASYNLTYQNETLGELMFTFARRVDADTLATAEDLIALVMPAIKNALAYRSACRVADAAQDLSDDETGTYLVDTDDGLLLLGIDDFQQIRRSHGDAWAQTLVETVQSQLQDGLREADSVFQIDDGLLAILLPRTTRVAALDVAAKVRVLIGSLHMRGTQITSQLTACMGIACTKHATNAEQVLEQARTALREAQQAGSNSVRVFKP